MDALLLHALLAQSYAQESTLDYEALLDEAVRFYHTGDRASAMQKFLSLSYNLDAPEPLRHEASVYIGEIVFVQGDKDSARRIFEDLLRDNPNYRIDQFRHPPEVCIFFDFVKGYMKIPEPPKPDLNPPKRSPIISYAPFGLYHLQYGERWKGYTYLGTQTITAASSLGLLLYLNSNNTYEEGDEEKKNMLENLMWTQRTSTLLFYGLWILSGVEAQSHWQLNLAITPSEGPSSMDTYIGIQGAF